MDYFVYRRFFIGPFETRDGSAFDVRFVAVDRVSAPDSQTALDLAIALGYVAPVVAPVGGSS